MRRIKISPGEYYHIYNRGNGKQDIFLDKSDYIRFLFCLLYFQSDITFNNIGYYVSQFQRQGKFNIDLRKLDKIVVKRNIEIINFVLMPNHFHITMTEVNEDGISKYMQRVLNSYTKYFNQKYKRSGHLFQGPYQAVHIEDNEQLLYLSTYIHKNPKKVRGIKWEKYFWSSYQDYTSDQRWGRLVLPGIILDQFKNNEEYQKFVFTSVAKD